MATRVMRGVPAMISVIVPVLNEEKHISEALGGLAEQTWGGRWEVLVVDNGCRDRTLEVVSAWESRLPSLTVVDASHGSGLNHARNAGAGTAQGEYLAFCDGDNVPAPGWLEALAEAAPSADLIGGSLEVDSLNDPLRLSWMDEGALDCLPTAGHGFLPFVPGGNCGIWASVAREVRWDEQFRFGSSDKEFAWRAQLSSYELVHAPGAVMLRRFRGTLRELASQQYRYGRSHPLLYRRFRGAGMPRPPLREVADAWVWVVRRLPRAVRDPITRGRWVRTTAKRAGRLVGSMRARVLFP